jgi:hypothetical protein
MKDSRIYVQPRKGRGIKEDVKECLDCIAKAGIQGPRMGGIERDHGIIRDIPYEDRDRVLKMLEDKDLQVVPEWPFSRQKKT